MGKILFKRMQFLFCALFLISLVVLPLAAGAAINADILANLQNTNLQDLGGTGTANLPRMIGNIVNILLGLLGVGFIILLIYAGFLYMTAMGKEDQTKTAKNLIRDAIIGLIIIFASYGITAFVINQLYSATTR